MTCLGSQEVRAGRSLIHRRTVSISAGLAKSSLVSHNAVTHHARLLVGTTTDTGAQPLSPSSPDVTGNTRSGNSNGMAGISRTIEYTRPSRNSAHIPPGQDMSMGMTTASSTAGPGPSSAGANRLMSPAGEQGGYFGSSSSKYESPLEKPWDLPMPTRTAPQPPMAGGLAPGGLAVQGGWERDPSGQASPGGTRTVKSAGNSPNPNRFSQGFEKANTAESSNGARGLASGSTQAPPRPSRAGTMPLVDSHPGLSAINTAVGPGGPHSVTSPAHTSARPLSSHSPYQSSPHMSASPSVPSPMPSSIPGYNRAPASSSVLNGGSSNNGHLAGQSGTSLQPPPLHHQPFSAPGNPYAQTSVLDSEVEKMVVPADEDKPKSRERSGTKSSSKEGKKGVFGFMTGQSPIGTQLKVGRRAHPGCIIQTYLILSNLR